MSGKPYIDENYLQLLLAQVGMNEDSGQRVDADETHFLARQLEHVRAQTYDILFPELRARQFIPVDTSVDAAAKTVTYRTWEMFGAAAIIANYADDSPRVDRLVRETTGRVRGIGATVDFDAIQAGFFGSCRPGRKFLDNRLNVFLCHYM